MAAAAPSRVMVRVRINDRTELGIRVNLMQECWTLRELVDQVHFSNNGFSLSLRYCALMHCASLFLLVSFISAQRIFSRLVSGWLLNL